MRDFLFKKDLWVIDLISSMIFALCMSAFVQYGADSGQKYWDRILLAMFYGGLSYLITFILALCLRKRFTSLRSWAWMGIIGALIQNLVGDVIYFRIMWDYELKFSATFSEAVINLLSILLKGLAWNWTLWAILGCSVIFAVRLVVYFFRGAELESFED